MKSPVKGVYVVAKVRTIYRVIEDDCLRDVVDEFEDQQS